MRNEIEDDEIETFLTGAERLDYDASDFSVTSRDTDIVCVTRLSIDRQIDLRRSPRWSKFALSCLVADEFGQANSDSVANGQHG